MTLNESTVETLRAEFPTLARWKHFALAHRAPLPRAAEQAMQSFLDDFHEYAGENAMSMEGVERARRSVSQLVGAPEGTLAFVKNTSEGINIVAAGLGLSEGDEVVVSVLEHEANLLPWRRLEASGVVLDIVHGGTDDVLEHIGEKTRAVAVSWITYGTGYRFDLARLGERCRAVGAHLVVDAIQGVGVLKTPLSELGADVVACGGHKGLLALAGAGFLYCRADVIERIVPPYSAKFSFATTDKWSDALELAPDARRFEYGNPNFIGIAVLEKTAELLMDIGLEPIEERVKALTTRLIERATSRGVSPATPTDWGQRAGIVSFELDDPHAVLARLREQSILASVKDDRYLRTACHFFNTEQEVDELADALR